MRSDLADYFEYDETSKSCLRWKVDRYSGRYHAILMTAAGDEAGYISSDGYYRVTLDSKSYLCHRIVFVLEIGALSVKDDVDHKDRNRSNNLKSNLRKVDRKTNTRNSRKNSNNVSGVTGVYKRTTHNGKYWLWAAEIRGLDGKKVIKAFSILKYGEQEAFRLACEYRERMIAGLNEQGAGYTDRHGK